MSPALTDGLFTTDPPGKLKGGKLFLKIYLVLRKKTILYYYLHPIYINFITWHQKALLICEVKVSQSCLTLQPFGLYSSSGQNSGMGSLSLLQGIFPTQGLNLGLPHCRWILYQLSHKGSPRVLEWVDSPFSRSSQPRN